MRNKSPEDRKIPTSISFTSQTLRRIEIIRDAIEMDRSAYVNAVLEEAMDIDEKRLRIIV
jgi:hypothetical protein